MIVKKYWRKYNRKLKHSDRMGYFLFGFIPSMLKCILGLVKECVNS